MEIDVHGPRHPTTWSFVPKSVDPATGKANASILEFDVDVFTNNTVRKIVNIVRPHLQSITIDVALILSKPQDSDVEEPCACLGLWRIEKVDFEECAVFPDLDVEDAAAKISMIASMLETDVGIAVEVAA